MLNKKFFFVPLVLLVTVIIPAVLAFILPSNPSQYYNAYKIKQLRWEGLDTPRIMIVGFSELAFGVDSKMIQDSTGYNVCNMALHGGLGADIICKDACKNVKRGDVVVFAFPLDLTSEGTADAQSLAFLIDLEPSKILELSPGNIIKFFRGIYPLLNGKVKYNISRLYGHEIVDEEYNCYNFNQYGDEYKHLDKTPPSGNPIRIHCGSIGLFNESLYNKIIASIQYMEKLGAKVIIIPELLEECNYEPNFEMIMFLEDRLKKDGFQYDIAPSVFLLDDSMCYFGVHANKKGVEFVTSSIIKALKTNGIPQ